MRPVLVGRPVYAGVVSDLDDLLSRLEELLRQIDSLDPAVRETVYELLDGFDALHRMALNHLAESLSAEDIQRLRSDPAVTWMLDAYSVGVDEPQAADAALEEIRPYIHSHGGRVEILDVEHGVVNLKMSGACSGCTASAITLREGIEAALRDHFPGFVRIEIEEDDAPSHDPPGPTLLQINRLEH